jgi:hypothetical protein
MKMKLSQSFIFWESCLESALWQTQNNGFYFGRIPTPSGRGRVMECSPRSSSSNSFDMVIGVNDVDLQGEQILGFNRLNG